MVSLQSHNDKGYVSISEFVIWSKIKLPQIYPLNRVPLQVSPLTQLTDHHSGSKGLPSEGVSFMDDSRSFQESTLWHIINLCYIYSESLGWIYHFINIGTFVILKIQIMLLPFFPLSFFFTINLKTQVYWVKEGKFIYSTIFNLITWLLIKSINNLQYKKFHIKSQLRTY